MLIDSIWVCNVQLIFLRVPKSGLLSISIVTNEYKYVPQTVANWTVRFLSVKLFLNQLFISSLNDDQV